MLFFRFTLLLWMVTGVPHAAIARETITLVADEWCPYNCGEDDVKQGYMVELAREAFAKHHIDVMYKVVPWADAIRKTRAGEYDAILGANRGDAPDFIYPEIIQGISLNQAWVREDSTWRYTNPSSLDDQKIAVVSGYAYGRILDPYIKARAQKNSPQMVVTATSKATEHNLTELVNGNVDVVFEDKNAVRYYFASRGLPMTLKAAGNPVDVRDYEDTYIFIAFSPNKETSTRYRELLVHSIGVMEKNGELEAILNRYNIDRNYRFPAENVGR